MHVLPNPSPARVRIGTFNVNGKLPSQDLAMWVQGQISGASNPKGPQYIPPLPDVSPFKVEDPTSSPLDRAVSDLAVADKNDASSLKESIHTSVSHASDSTLVQHGPETTAQKGPDAALEQSEPDGVDKSANIMQGDPDVIVLGFQELDLSTGALLYSTETTREDAWFSAAMAGLGEKAEHYEKVSFIYVLS